MSILIKDMEMPKEGHVIVLISTDGKVHKLAEYVGTWDEVATAVPASSTQNVLDKIRAEFINKYPKNYMGEPELNGARCVFSLNNVLDVIDKYRAESENL